MFISSLQIVFIILVTRYDVIVVIQHIKLDIVIWLLITRM